MKLIIYLETYIYSNLPSNNFPRVIVICITNHKLNDLKPHRFITMCFWGAGTPQSLSVADDSKIAKEAGDILYSSEGQAIHISQFWMLMYIYDQLPASVISYFTNCHPVQFL